MRWRVGEGKIVRARIGLRHALVACLIVSLVMLAACGGTTTQSSQEDGGSSVGRSGATAPTTAIGETTSMASASTTPSEEAGARLTVVPEGSEARYRVQEQLVGRDLPNDAVGTTSDITGQIVVDPSGRVVPEQSRVTVDMASLQSDSERRDSYIRQNTLETDRFPSAEFIVREAPGLPSPLPTSGEERFQLVGDLTVHGVTSPAIWEVIAQFGKEEATAVASTRVSMTDFGMTPPRVGPVLSVEDEAGLELGARLRRDALET